MEATSSNSGEESSPMETFRENLLECYQDILQVTNKEELTDEEIDEAVRMISEGYTGIQRDRNALLDLYMKNRPQDITPTNARALPLSERKAIVAESLASLNKEMPLLDFAKIREEAKRELAKEAEEKLSKGRLTAKRLTLERRSNEDESRSEDSNVNFFVKEIQFQLPQQSLNFIGRTEELNTLYNTLNKKRRVVLSVAINGMGGVGKTQTATMYMSKFEQEYHSMVWIHSETQSDLEGSFENLATECGILVEKKIDDQMVKRDIKSIVNEVYKYFSVVKQKCLFTFDNCESYDEVRLFLPPHNLKNIHVLITSRNSDWLDKESHRIQTIKLDVFTPELAIEYLKENLQIDYDASVAMQELAETLGYLPLALRHATAYIKKKRSKQNGVNKNLIEDYLREFNDESKTKNLLDSKLDNYDRTILTMVNVTFNILKSEKKGELALELMQIMAFCPPDVKRAESLFSRLKKDVLYEALDLLEQSSLINIKEFKDYDGIYYRSVNIHRLVQKVVRLNVNDEGKLLGKYLRDCDVAWKIKNELSIIWGFASKHPSLIDKIDFNSSHANIPLTLLSEIGNLEGVQRILTHAQENRKDLSQIIREPLSIACNNGHLEIVQLLLDQNADVNLADKYGYTPLAYACSNGHIDIVQLLLDQNADVNLADKDGWTPLTNACFKGHMEIVQLLLDQNADVNLVGKGGSTPLTNACFSGHMEIVQLLLDQNADVNLVDEHGFTPLVNACIMGHMEIVQLLLDQNADVNLADEDGETPLMKASRRVYTRMLQILLNYGADVNLCDKWGNNAIQYASIYLKDNNQKQVLSILRNENNE